MKLTERTEYSAATLGNLIHIVVTNDTSQNSAGSSYKIPLSKVVDLVPKYWTSGSTGLYSIKANSNSPLDAIGDYAVAEGNDTHAEGFASHAEGESTTASGDQSHAEGLFTVASGDSSHSEGYGTSAIGYASHAGGSESIANGAISFVHGDNSFAGGVGTIVLGNGLTGLTDNTTFVNQLVIISVPRYASDGDADADTSLPSGGLYAGTGTTAGSRVLRIKP